MLGEKLLEAAGNAAPSANYVEDVFSTYLYTGNGSTQTITNGIDLAGKGGLVWQKSRTSAYNNRLVDTVRGGTNALFSDLTNAQVSNAGAITSFNSDGFSIGAAGGSNNASGEPIVSWTFRKQPKFFDVVTYTGNGTDGRAIAHSLGSTPGCIIVKSTTLGTSWAVYHRGMATSNPESWEMYLNTTAARTVNGTWGGAPTSTNFYVNNLAAVNQGGDTYVAYIFAHNAGGFGLTGTDNVISCGSFTTDGSGNATVNLGYEPQWVTMKCSSSAQNWLTTDVMRGMSLGQTSSNVLFPNLSNAEYTAWSASSVYPTSTGFYANGSASGGLIPSATYIYIAIRRGPMKVPTDATKVFAPIARNGTGATATIAGLNFPPDLYIGQQRPASSNAYWCDRLRGRAAGLKSTDTNAETTSPAGSDVSSFDQSGVTLGTGYNANINPGNGNSVANWMFQRAPSFFDEVCYTGTGSARTVTHNLGVAPELMIVKKRSLSGTDWLVYNSTIGATAYLSLNTTAASNSYTFWNNTSPTSNVFSLDVSGDVNQSGQTYVAYLFATCSGVSKVGSYTGNGSSQTINCGFTGGARFVLIKRTDSTGDWYVYDTARGMTTLTDPYLLLNSTAAESATLGSVTTVTTGFAVNASILAAINTNGASYVFFAVA